MKKKKALIAMSGGVDSSVAAYLMINEGYECIGATMQLLDNSKQAIDDASAVAKSLGIPFHVFDMRNEFRNTIIDSFIASYENGETPNPCILCNKYIKFGSLLKKAEELGCDTLVTGHYAKIAVKDGKYLLKKAEDKQKDQSYFLYSLTPEVLSKVQFPLGNYTKAQIREIADKLQLPTAKKHDSQDICFVPNGDYAMVIKSITGKTYAKGDFVDTKGNVLGVHDGIIKYTIGQRKGLGIALGQPAYVVGKDVDQNKVILGSNDDLFAKILHAKDFNSIAIDNNVNEFRCNARVRYRHEEQPASVVLQNGRITVTFDKPQRAITAGQSVVLYKDDIVLGGGIIE